MLRFSFNKLICARNKYYGRNKYYAGRNEYYATPVIMQLLGPEKKEKKRTI